MTNQFNKYDLFGREYREVCLPNLFWTIFGNLRAIIMDLLWIDSNDEMI